MTLWRIPTFAAPASQPSTNPVSLKEALYAPHDLYAEAALRQPNGPSYEFFAKVLPPLRYVDAPFHHYPIVLSAPSAAVKARLLSNGSAINALARQPNWRGEVGIPVTFRVGDAREGFGSDLRRLDGPKFLNGYLPIVQLRYRQGKSVYSQECFVPTDPEMAAHGVVLVQFTLATGESGLIEAEVEGIAPYKAKGNVLLNAEGKTIVAYGGEPWNFNPARNTLTAHLGGGTLATLAIYTQPADQPFAKLVSHYDEQYKAAVVNWDTLLNGGTSIETPEPVVNNAWRSTLIGNYVLAKDDAMRYSAGNQYAQIYIAEGSDAIQSLLLYGHAADARRLMPSLFDFTRKGLEFHQGALKLRLLANYYWLTRDAEFLRAQRSRWQKELDRLVNGREKDSGLFPKEKYCGDIDTRVYSLNANANAWRALRDFSAVLADLGGEDMAQAQKLAAIDADFRKSVLAALDKSIDHKTDPPFIPVAMFGEEPAYDYVAASRMGSYWNIMSSFVLGSGVFRYDSPTADSLVKFLQTHGARFMGQNRAFPEKSFWMEQTNVNDLYGMRYALALQQRDQPDDALVCFYGKLAIGMTRDTFIGCEGSCLRPVDDFGRQMYLPPNSAANANFLQQLRYLLVQDFDQNDVGHPDTLRLCFATPRAWLEDGKTIRVTNAPTAFGPVSFTIQSHLAERTIEADLTLPPPAAAKTLLRLRLPSGWRITSARAADQPLTVASETIDVTGLTGRSAIRAALEPAK